MQVTIITTKDVPLVLQSQQWDIFRSFYLTIFVPAVKTEVFKRWTKRGTHTEE